MLAIDCYGERLLYVWPLHVLRKKWVEPYLFLEAFKVAIETHRSKCHGEVDWRLLEASFDEALLRRSQYMAHPRRSYKPARIARSTFPRRDRLVAYSQRWHATVKGAGAQNAQNERIEADAAVGIVPAAPDFSADIHKRFRKRLSDIVALVEVGNIKALKTMTIKPVNSSNIAMARYRDLAVIALKAQRRMANADRSNQTIRPMAGDVVGLG